MSTKMKKHKNKKVYSALNPGNIKPNKNKKISMALSDEAKRFFTDGVRDELRIHIADPSGRQKRIFGNVIDVLIFGPSIECAFLKVHSKKVRRYDKLTQESHLVDGDSIVIIPLAAILQAFSISFARTVEEDRELIEQQQEEMEAEAVPDAVEEVVKEETEESVRSEPVLQGSEEAEDAASSS